MDSTDIIKKSDQELRTELAELREQLRELRFKLVSGDLKKVREVRGVKKTIARMLTELNKRARKTAA